MVAFINYIFRVFIKGFLIFIGEGSSSIGRLFKAAKAKVADNIKGVNRCNLKQQLIIYELKGPLLLINSLISLFNYSVELFSWAASYSTYSTNLLFLLKTYTLLRQSSCLSLLITDLLASLNICILKLLKSS